MSKWRDVKRIQARRLKARERALRTWRKRHAERKRLAELDPIRVGGRIVERLVRIIGEKRVIERTFHEYDRPCDWKRKRKEVFVSSGNSFSGR